MYKSPDFPLSKLSFEQLYERRQEQLYITQFRETTKALVYLRNCWYQDLLKMGLRKDYIA